MILILYTQLSEDSLTLHKQDEKLDGLLPLLPDSRKTKLQRIRHTQTRVASALGLLLLRQGMHRLGIGEFSLQELIYSENFKPHCPGRYDFNISHSNSLIACAISENSSIGIDVEKLREINPERFDRLLSFSKNRTTDMSRDEFFDIWTKKESVVKADGKAGVWDIGKVEIDDCKAIFRDRLWLLTALDMPEGYIAHIAYDSTAENDNIELLSLSADNLLSDYPLGKKL